MVSKEHLLFTILGLLTLAFIGEMNTVFAQVIPHEGFEFRQRTRNSPNQSLPEQVNFKPGALSLIHDATSVEANRIEVYVINATDSDYRFERRTLDLPIVLEVELGEGIWERAEVRNDVSNYSSRTVKELILSQHYRQRKCQYWTSGEPAKLRYALYEQGRPIVVSESFDGFLPMGVVHSARHDLMSELLTPKVLQIRYQTGNTIPFETVRDQWLPKLNLLYQLGPAHIELEEVQKWTADIHSNPVSTRAEQDLAIQLQTKMLGKWQHHYNSDQLYKYCVEAAVKRIPQTQSVRHICWKLLQESVEESKSLPHPELASTAWQFLQPSKEAVSETERKAIANFLCSTTVAKRFNPLSSVKNPEQIFKSDDLYLRIVAANWYLLQRKPDFDVINFYRSSPPEDLTIYELINILHFNRIHNPYTKRNWDLWVRALQMDTDYTISNLALIYDFDERKFPVKFKASEENFPASFKTQLLSVAREKSGAESARLAMLILHHNSKKIRSNRLNLQF